MKVSWIITPAAVQQLHQTPGPGGVDRCVVTHVRWVLPPGWIVSASTGPASNAAHNHW